MTTYRLMDGLSGRPGNGPAAATSFSGNLVVGCVFGVSQGGLWFTGYYWWVPASGGDTASGQKFALWQQKSGGLGGALVPGGTVTAGALAAGAWNFVALPAPLLLTPFASGAATTYGAVYAATTGKTFTSGFPETKNQFGTGDPFAAGITNGPLSAFSSETGSAPAGGSGNWNFQEPFTVAGGDPSVSFPTANDSDANLWLDVQVSDTAPVSPAYRTFPNSPVFVVPGVSGQASAYTLGLEFTLSQKCLLSKIWHYSPGDATVLPARCGIWDVASQTEVAGSDNSSPSWKNAAGSPALAADGWIYCDYSAANVTLNGSQNYKVSTFTSDNTHTWFLAQSSFWGTAPDPFPSGITQGILQTPGNAASTNGQDSWHQSATWTYPATSTNPEFDGLDVEVTPVAASASGGLLLATFP